MKINKIIISKLHNPWLHLGLEETLLREGDPNESVLILYSNSPCIIMGNFQNPWREININSNGLPVIRRFSGGGTVYHDLGNLNFSFIRRNSQIERCKNLQYIRDRLLKEKFPVKINERHDLIATKDGKEYKISGSAFKNTKDNSLHHGTLLIDADLQELKGVLNPTIENIQTKAVASVKSTVCNLSEFDSRVSVEKVTQWILNETNLNQKISFSFFNDFHELFLKAQSYSEKYLDKSWTWNKTPAFSVASQFENENCELFFEKGRLIKIINNGDIIEQEERLDLYEQKEQLFQLLKKNKLEWVIEKNFL